MSAEIILSTHGVERHFGGVKAVAGVDFALERGELRCLIGPNGAGKSTFFKMLSGQLRPSAGEIRLFDRPAQDLQAHEIADQGVGIKNQIPDVMNGLTARENLWLAASRCQPAALARRTVDEMAERLCLGGVLNKLVGTLAHGQRQWVEIAMVLVARPRLILLDEPAAGMSDEETEATAILLREINTTTTIIVVEHDMAFIRAIARKVTVFHQGRILMEDGFEAVMRDEQVRNVYLGRTEGAKHA
jgi:branched-chain amino acid transport system ATP-binding protein/urea transport system ATP-binding protein